MAEKREIDKKVKKWQKRVDKREEEHEQLQYLNMKRKRDKQWSYRIKQFITC